MVTEHEAAMPDADEQSKVDFFDQYKELAREYSSEQIYSKD